METSQVSESRFVKDVLFNPYILQVLQRARKLVLPDWYLTAGCLFQTVWNILSEKDPASGILDYDLFYFDADDLSYEAEDAIIRESAQAFRDLPINVEVRNEARVHLWYEQHFGKQIAPFRSCEDAIDHFASPTCSFGLRLLPLGEFHVYAPFGFGDLYGLRVRPNKLLAPKHVYESKCSRWKSEWPALQIDAWESIGLE